MYRSGFHYVTLNGDVYVKRERRRPSLNIELTKELLAAMGAAVLAMGYKLLRRR